MSALHTLDELAWDLAAWACGAALTSLVMLAAVALVWVVVRRRASAHVGYVLFLLPLLPLVLPPGAGFELPLPVGERAAQLFHGEGVVRTNAPGPAGPRGDSDRSHVGERRANSAARPVRVTPSPGAAGSGALGGGGGVDGVAPLGVEPAPVPIAAGLALGWLLVVGALFARFLVAQVRTLRLVRTSRPLGADDRERVRSALALAPGAGRLARGVRLVECDAVPSPAAWGFLRPCVLLPPGMARRLDPDQLAWVLLHELEHLRRRDALVASAQRVIGILWFFHPLVWINNRLVEDLRECSCDESALARCRSLPRRRLAEALLSVASWSIPTPPPGLVLQPLRGQARPMKNRIMRMLDTSRTSRAGLAPASVPFLLALASLAAVSPEPAQGDDGDAPRLVAGSAAASDDVEEARVAIARSLVFLAAQQQADGHFPTGPSTEEDTGEFNSVGVTGLVVLALLDDADPAHRPAVDRALEYLEGVQDEETGIFGGVQGYRYMASHAVATRAFIRASDGDSERAWKPRAERAVAAILKARNPYSGWRFDHTPTGDNDSFMTSLMLVTLRTAAEAGFEVPGTAVDRALGYLDSLYDESTGRTGYDSRGGPSPRLFDKLDAFPPEHSELCTAVSILARSQWGEAAASSADLVKSAGVLVDRAPRWDLLGGTVDYYHFLFGTEAMASLGGFSFEYWRAELFAALLPNQQRARSGAFWPAVDAWSSEGTTVHSTVLNTLALQAATR